MVSVADAVEASVLGNDLGGDVGQTSLTMWRSPLRLPVGGGGNFLYGRNEAEPGLMGMSLRSGNT